MRDIYIKYNPYKPETVIRVDGKDVTDELNKYSNRFIQEWAEELPHMLSSVLDDNSFNLTFCGTDEDFKELRSAFISAAKDGLRADIRQERAIKTVDRAALESLLDRSQVLSSDKLQRIREEVEKAFNDELEVNVVAIMSAGKSTLINALLQRQLMPSQNKACTAKIVRIENSCINGTEFSADIFDTSNPPCYLDHIDGLTARAMKELNSGEDSKGIGSIRISGRIPFVDDDVRLVLVDTPGIDNALDKAHKAMTEAALDASSKNLIIFVMDVGHNHSDSEAWLLHRIAESINGNKDNKSLARDRFLFVINKVDLHRKDEDNLKETIQRTREYLYDDYGIEDPRIFPVSAITALLARQYMYSTDAREREEIMDGEDTPLSSLARKLSKRDELNLEKYDNVPESVKKIIKSELADARNADDICGEAIVHSGIRNLEEIINLYITKYCRPQKIKNAIESLRVCFAADMNFGKMEYEIANGESEISKIAEQVRILERELGGGVYEDRNNRFRRRIEALSTRDALVEDLTDIASSITKRIREFIERLPKDDRVSEADANSLSEELKRMKNNIEAEFPSRVERAFVKNVKKTCEELMNEYLSELKDLTQKLKIDGGISIDLPVLVKGELSALDISSEFARAKQTETLTSYVERTRTETKRAEGWERLKTPRWWFDPTYTVEVPYTDTIRTTNTYYQPRSIADNFMSEVTGSLNKKIDDLKNSADAETQKVKQVFLAMINKVNADLTATAQKLHALSADKESKAKELQQIREKYAKLKSLNDELDRLINI